MPDREVRHFPKPQDHSLKVYSAILGQNPTVAPDGKMIIHPRGAGFWQKADLVLRELRRAIERRQLSPAVRARLEPLLAPARKRWLEARERLTACAARAVAATEKPPQPLPRRTPPAKHPGQLSASGVVKERALGHITNGIPGLPPAAMTERGMGAG